jgi:hypothetical protein
MKPATGDKLRIAGAALVGLAALATMVGILLAHALVTGKGGQ